MIILLLYSNRKIGGEIKEVKGGLMILDTLGIKPNYSEIGRAYGKHRSTVKKYHNGYEGKPKTRNKASKLNKHYEEIKEKLLIPGSTVKGVYEFILRKDPNIGTCSNFNKYVIKHKLKPNKANKLHLRFETDYGEQLQFDWKEDIKMISKKGEIFQFNVLSSTLCASRLHIFCYSKNRTKEDVYRCLIETFKYINGVPKETLTDNMSSIANTTTKKFYPEYIQFCKDMGCNPKKCKPRSPQTKGKDESSNRFMSWLVPYNNEFETEEDLIKILEYLNKKINKEVNTTTGITPIMLYQKEKEHLLPLPSNKVLDSYLLDTKAIKVSDESLIYYKGKKYSVPPKLINQTIKLKELDNKLYIYYNSDLVTMHNISNKPINYLSEHYKEGLSMILTSKSEIEIDVMVEKNLKLFDSIGSN